MSLDHHGYSYIFKLLLGIFIVTYIFRLGTVSACGLASSMNLPTSVAPFILRGVTLAGIECVYLPLDRRVSAYNLLSEYCPADKLDLIGANDIIGNFSKKCYDKKIKL